MMALLYNAADVYMGASMSEGFGIPLIEAQACGLPVVTTDFSAMPELVRWGHAVKPADMVWTPLNSWQAWPDVHGIRDALDRLYEAWDGNGRRWDVSERLHAQDHIHEEFGWDAIVRDQWQPLLDRLSVMAPELRTRKVAA
jgi:glycosyltransferase involved in cell wall biosynthesis